MVPHYGFAQIRAKNMEEKENYVMSISSPFSCYSLSGTVSRVFTQHLDCVWNCLYLDNIYGR